VLPYVEHRQAVGERVGHTVDVHGGYRHRLSFFAARPSPI
jgi:hypothetical protein